MEQFPTATNAEDRRRGDISESTNYCALWETEFWDAQFRGIASILIGFVAFVIFNPFQLYLIQLAIIVMVIPYFIINNGAMLFYLTKVVRNRSKREEEHHLPIWKLLVAASVHTTIGLGLIGLLVRCIWLCYIIATF